MNSILSIVDTWMWYIICIVSIVFLAASITIVFRTVIDTRKIRPLLFAFANLILSFGLFFVLMDVARVPFADSGDRIYLPVEFLAAGLPWFFYVICEVIIGVLILICSRDNMKYRKENITAETTRLAIDLLPEGISISDHDGTIRLSNLRMNELSQELTGEILTNAKRFWSVIEEKGKDQGGSVLVRNGTDSVWVFEREKIEVDGKDYDQITATDVTERYKIIDKLEAKHELLQIIQRRMKAVTDLSGDMFVAQEEADARAALHNQLGQVLLMGRHYITHMDTTDPAVVYLATKQMNMFMLRESEEPYNGEDDELNLAVSMANSIGVRVDVTGEYPKMPAVRKLLAQAITECAANTVKHAEGDTVSVDISDDEIALTNNGRAPKRKITESGGLLSLRRNIEDAGGEMVLESEPRFRLVMKITKKLKNGTNG